MKTGNTSSPEKPARRLYGCLVRREFWFPSHRILFGSLVLGAIALFWAIRSSGGFLAVTERAPAKILVVEGWIPTSVMRQAVAEFRNGGYEEVLTSGCLTFTDDPGAKPGSTYAEWGAHRLRYFGLTEVPVIAVSSRQVKQDRTYSAALAIRHWLQTNRPEVKTINILTVGPHARRTRLLYEMALGDGIDVGIIAIDKPEYDASNWWCTSEGVRDVVGEGVAYAYARLLFWAFRPSSPPPPA